MLLKITWRCSAGHLLKLCIHFFGKEIKRIRNVLWLRFPDSPRQLCEISCWEKPLPCIPREQKAFCAAGVSESAAARTAVGNVIVVAQTGEDVEQDHAPSDFGISGRRGKKVQ